jgi:hypothetical protein
METPNKTLTDFGIQITESMTTPIRPGKKPRPVFIVSGRVTGYEETLRDLGGKKFRGQWSFWSDPSTELLTAINRYGKLTFAEQVEARCERKLNKSERYDGYAKSAEDRATSNSQAAQEIGSHIPMGQPILVGHHSERRHRRDLDRIDSKMRRSIEEGKKSEYYSDKSENLQHDAKKISEDRSYIMNRIEEEEAYSRRLRRNSGSYSDYTTHITDTQEKIDYWKNRLKVVEGRIQDTARRIASPENIKIGFWIKYLRQWFKVIRVSKKSVTVCNWLGVESLTWKTRYADIDDFREPSEVRSQNTELNSSDLTQGTAGNSNAQ